MLYWKALQVKEQEGWGLKTGQLSWWSRRGLLETWSYLEPDLTLPPSLAPLLAVTGAEKCRWPVHYREQTVLSSLLQTWRHASLIASVLYQWQTGCGLADSRVWECVCVYMCVCLDVGQLVVGCRGPCWTNTQGDPSGMEWKWPAITLVHLYFGVFVNGTSVAHFAQLLQITAKPHTFDSFIPFYVLLTYHIIEHVHCT